jgi:hypothetical protein
MVMGEMRSGGKGADDLAADQAVGVERRSVKRLFRSPPVRAGCLHAAPRLSAAPQPRPRPKTPHHVPFDHRTNRKGHCAAAARRTHLLGGGIDARDEIRGNGDVGHAARREEGARKGRIRPRQRAEPAACPISTG